VPARKAEDRLETIKRAPLLRGRVGAAGGSEVLEGRRVRRGTIAALVARPAWVPHGHRMGRVGLRLSASCQRTERPEGDGTRAERPPPVPWSREKPVGGYSYSTVNTAPLPSVKKT
jgi:hypothetical protein